MTVSGTGNTSPGNPTPKQVKAAAKAEFNALNTDKQGTSAKSLSEAEMGASEAAQARHARYDADGDGKVSKKEFITGAAADAANPPAPAPGGVSAAQRLKDQRDIEMKNYYDESRSSHLAQVEDALANAVAAARKNPDPR